MSVKKGSLVTIEYEGMFENGVLFDSSHHGDHSHPITFTVGEKQVIEGLEKAVVGMNEGEEKKFSISPQEGYGMHDERLLREVPQNTLPQDTALSSGMTLGITTPDGKQIPVSIAKVENEIVTLDFNHPLAGKTLIFKIKIVGIDKKPPVHNHH
ncbi:MAG: peptidylprolyl isomerase [Nanoarchaeota archaeon]